jgi:hypothetical protein
MKRLIYFVIFLINLQVFSQTYDALKAATYAQKWCNDRNIDYPDYGGLDCANFVSQCLIEGGLDLSKGANGKGQGVEKPYGVIPNARNLSLHLSGYQNTSIRKVKGFNPPPDHGMGDPVFQLKKDTAKHSLLCSSLDGNARKLYCCHGENHCDADWPNYNYIDTFMFFHIKPIPAHCYDCKKNNGEEEIDCGGTCPPCDRAIDRVIINTPTNNLPTEVRATEEISAGNAAVKVLSGQNVNFITSGTINLLPGFEVEAGGNFETQMKGNIFEVTADCGEYCNAETYYPTYIVKFQDYLTAHDLVNIDRVYFEVSNVLDQWIYGELVRVYRDGTVPLWDFVTGVGDLPTGRYAVAIWLISCKNQLVNSYAITVFVSNGKKSLNEEPETSPPLLSPNIENSVSQNEKAPPYFSIIPNPNPGAFRFDTNFPLTDIGSIKVINLQGTTVYETQNVTNNTIQLPTATSGQFFVVMILKDGNVLTQKMVVQR